MAESNDDTRNEQPEEVSSEDVVGGQETPSADALDREQAIVEEPVAESEQRAAEETSISGAGEDEEDLEYIEEKPREKPAIPGMDLEVDIVREDDAYAGRPRYSEDEYDDDEEPVAEGEEELPATIADASIDLAAGARYRATGKWLALVGWRRRYCFGVTPAKATKSRLKWG